MSQLRKFIAGAECPECKQVDKLFVTEQEGTLVCECVACGFRESRERDAQPGTREFAKGLGDAATETSVVSTVEP